MIFLKRYWRIIFPIFFIIVIWCFSATSGDASNAESLKVASIFGLPNAVMRKLAHMALFGALGYSVASYIKGLHAAIFPNARIFISCVIPVVVYGAIDEVHQLTVAGRNATINDVIIDSIAGICGVLVYIAIFCFYRRWKLYHIIRKKN